MSARDIVINLVTKSDKKGLAETEKGLKDLDDKAEKAGGKFGGLSGLLGKFGDNVAKDLTGKLGVAGEALDKTEIGLGDMAGKTAAAGAAIAGLGAFIAGGVQKLGELYDNTRNFNEVAGTTWEEGSKLIAVFDDLRVSSDEGASAIGKLTKTAGTSPDTFKQFGIEIAHAKDGTVDMTGTLANVADAFQNTKDPAQRAAMGTALFGKSWATIVPVLNQGGTSLKKLIDGVDDSQVATEKGAKEQQKLFAATDNLKDAIAGLQMELAEHLIPTLAGAAEGTTEVVGWFDKLAGAAQHLGPSFEESQESRKFWLEWLDRTGPASDHVGQATDGLSNKIRDGAGYIRDMAAGLIAQAGGLVNSEARIKDATKAYDDFKKKVDDLLQQQEDMRTAQLETEDTSLAYEKAQIAAGDASGELSDKAKLAAEAVEQHGADSDEAKIATENYRRALLDARVAMDGSADAAVNNAVKIAEGNGVVLTAAEKIAVYRDEMIRLQTGAADPGLHSSLQSVIDKYAELARQAQNAAANIHGLRQEQAQQAGIEREYTSRDSSGAAVVRRASGGPVWPGQSYLVHKDEIINLPKGTGPGDVLSPPESGRFTNAFPTINTNADGSVQFGGDPATYPGSVVKVGTPPKFPTLNVANGGPGGIKTLAGYEPSTSAASGHTSAVAVTYNITVNGYADIKGLVAAIKQYEAARK